jgi:hypothetical protein
MNVAIFVDSGLQHHRAFNRPLLLHHRIGSCRRGFEFNEPGRRRNLFSRFNLGSPILRVRIDCLGSLRIGIRTDVNGTSSGANICRSPTHQISLTARGAAGGAGRQCRCAEAASDVVLLELLRLTLRVYGVAVFLSQRRITPVSFDAAGRIISRTSVMPARKPDRSLARPRRGTCRSATSVWQQSYAVRLTAAVALLCHALPRLWCKPILPVPSRHEFSRGRDRLMPSIFTRIAFLTILERCTLPFPAIDRRRHYHYKRGSERNCRLRPLRLAGETIAWQPFKDHTDLTSSSH